MANQPTIRAEVSQLKDEVRALCDSVCDLNRIEITVKNGKEKHISYKRSEFFQMLYDRKTMWKERIRITAKDILLFGGVGTLILHEIFGIF